MHIGDSAPDLTLTGEYRANGVLGNIDPDRLAEFILGPTFVIACGDKDRRFWEAVAHMSELTGIPVAEFGMQPLVINGAPLYVSMVGTPENEVIMTHYRQAKQLKGVDKVLILGHGPCGAAGLLGLSLEANFARTMDARLTAEAVFELPAKSVMAAFHLDLAPNKKRLYVFKRKPFLSRNGSGVRPQE